MQNSDEKPVAIDIPKKTTLVDLEAAFAVTETEFAFTVGKKKIRARAVSDASEILNLEKHAKVLQEMCAAGHPEYKPYLPVNPAVVRMCCYMDAFLIEPKMPFVAALKLAKTCGLLIPEIFTELTEHNSAKVLETQAKAVDDAKNE